MKNSSILSREKLKNRNWDTQNMSLEMKIILRLRFELNNSSLESSK